MTVTQDIAGVVAKPPYIYGGVLLAGGVVSNLVPALGWPANWPLDVPRIAGLVLVAIGILLMAAGVLQFKRHGTPVPTDQPTTALVTTGVYGFSRNPLYLALTAIYLGIGLLLPSLLVLALVVPVLILMHYGVVVREEAYLERKFGEPYRAYKKRVRRWL
jgi:protein-S-isoprenylcysteine O-methyltransferase Ste14